MPLTFPRELRLLTSDHFNFVFQHPLRAGTSQIVILGRPNKIRHPRMGLSIAKKNIKHACVRNRIKRLTRESFRHRQHALPPMDFVVVVKKGIECCDNPTLTKVLEKLWRRYYH